MNIHDFDDEDLQISRMKEGGLISFISADLGVEVRQQRPWPGVIAYKDEIYALTMMETFAGTVYWAYMTHDALKEEGAIMLDEDYEPTGEGMTLEELLGIEQCSADEYVLTEEEEAEIEQSVMDWLAENDLEVEMEDEPLEEDEEGDGEWSKSADWWKQ